MAKKKEAAKQKTFKPMPDQAPDEGQLEGALEVTQQDEVPGAVAQRGQRYKPDLIAELLKVEGMNQEMAEHMAAHGIPGDSFTVQTFYRVSAVTADAVIKVFEEMTK